MKKTIISIEKCFLKAVKKIMLLLFFPKKINKKSIAFYSDPDVSDNSLAIFLYIKNMNLSGWTFIWVVGDVKSSKEVLKKIEPNISNVLFLRKNSIYAWIKTRYCKYQFDTHGAPYEKPFLSKRISICLWHGSPLKLIGNSINPGSFNGGQDITVCAHSVFIDPISEGLNVKKEKIFIGGYPRNDFIFTNKNYKTKFIVWMPTYASSVGSADGRGYKGKDSVVSNNSFGAIDFSQLNFLNKILLQLNIVLKIKLHPYDARNFEENEQYSNIFIIKNSDISNFGLSTYKMLANSCALISDCSSVIFDYMLTGKPIAIDTASLEGFVRPMLFDLVKSDPGLYKINNIDEFISFAEKIKNNSYKINYDVKKYNKDCEFNFCKKIVELVGIS